MISDKIKVIAFDGDDTLWINEPYYQECEKIFCGLLKDYFPVPEVSAELLKTEIQNIELYGYGAKGFMLSMIETAIRISNNTIPGNVIEQIIKLGKQLIEMPIELIDEIEPVLRKLKASYKIILATKGDLLDQQRKLKKSGLTDLFDHIEIMSDKKEADYTELLKRLNIPPECFLMVGNSLKSDILPVLKIGGQAIYIPFHTTWKHEQSSNNPSEGDYIELEKISEIIKCIIKE